MKRSRFRGLSLITLCAMALGAATALAGSDAPSFTQSRYDAKIVVDKALTLKAGARLYINVDDIDVYVKKMDGKQSSVQVFVAGPDRERALEFFDDLNFEIVESENEIEMTSDSPNYDSGSFWRKHRGVQVWAIVAVPVQCEADITTNDGDVRIDELDGNFKLRTKDGDIEVVAIKGADIDIKSSDGDIAAGSLEARNEIVVSTSDGNIQAKRLVAKQLSLDTSDGDIAAGHIEGDDIRMRSSDGDIEVDVSGGDLRAACSDGDMQIRLLEAMSVDLKSRDGDIDIIVPDSFDLDVELKGEDVAVRGGNLTKGNVSRHGVVGSLNRGGPLVRARSNDGTIALRLR